MFAIAAFFDRLSGSEKPPAAQESNVSAQLEEVNHFALGKQFRSQTPLRGSDVFFNYANESSNDE